MGGPDESRMAERAAWIRVTFPPHHVPPADMFNMGDRAVLVLCEAMRVTGVGTGVGSWVRW